MGEPQRLLSTHQFAHSLEAAMETVLVVSAAILGVGLFGYVFRLWVENESVDL
jgi:hypothetical protein